MIRRFRWVALLLCLPYFANGQSFYEFRDKIQAHYHGEGEVKLASTLDGVKPYRRFSAQIAQANAPQTAPEKVENWIKSELNGKTVRATKAFLTAHRQSLLSLKKRYGIHPEILAALWQINHSQLSGRGNQPLPIWMTKTAEQPTKSNLLELDALLRLINLEDCRDKPLLVSLDGQLLYTRLSPSMVKTSWGGALDCPFTTEPTDGLARLALWLNHQGWEAKKAWGWQVKGTQLERYEGDENPLWKWQIIGVTRFNGKALPKEERAAKLFSPQADLQGRQYLTYTNFTLLEQYLGSKHQALLVLLLADRLRFG